MQWRFTTLVNWSAGLTVKAETVGIGEVVKISWASNLSKDILWTTFKSIGSRLGSLLGLLVVLTQFCALILKMKLGKLFESWLGSTLGSSIEQIIRKVLGSLLVSTQFGELRLRLKIVLLGPWLGSMLRTSME